MRLNVILALVEDVCQLPLVSINNHHLYQVEEFKEIQESTIENKAKLNIEEIGEKIQKVIKIFFKKNKN